MRQLIPLVIAVVMFWAPSAAAACRTTTCNPAVSCATSPEHCCIYNESGCDENGIPIAWPSSCVSYSIGESGAPSAEITAIGLSDRIDSAFALWLEQQGCDGERPALRADNFGFSSCEVLTVNTGTQEANANVWFFQDNSWPYEEGSNSLDANAAALTTVTFDASSGAIYDVDVELNSATFPLAISGDGQTIALQSIIEHEAGHFLGLDHSNIPDSVMWPAYMPGRSGGKLSEDDVMGVCAGLSPKLFTPEKSTCEPEGGYDKGCGESAGGCAFYGVPNGRSASLIFAWVLTTALFSLAWRR